MASTAATQTTTTGTPAASGGSGSAAGGQPAADSKAADGQGGTTGAANGAGGETTRTSALGGEPGKEAGAGQGQKGAEGDKPKGPEGELEIKLPAGMKVDDAALAAFKAVGKEAGLNSEQASKLAAWDAERQAKAVNDAVAAWEKQDDAWAAELKADPVIGGDKYDASVQAAQRAVRHFGGDDLRRFLIDHGIGNAPELVRAFAKIGGAMAEDKTSAGAGGNADTRPKPMSREERALDFYNSIQPKKAG